MTCCNGDIINLGCYFSCDLITTGLTAAATGVYTLVLQPSGTKVVSNTISFGNSIVFSGGYLNEDALSVFKIIDPSGNYVTSGDSDCFKVTIRPASTPSLANIVCPPSGESVCNYDIQINGVATGQSVTLTNCEDLTINLI